MSRRAMPVLGLFLAAALVAATAHSRRGVRDATVPRAGAGASSAPTYDVLIRGGQVIDGTGAAGVSEDVAITGGRIAAVGHLAGATAKRVIDAHGMVVAPGFIDMLGQSELTLLVDPRAPSKIFQGITTEITGEGESVAPLTPEMVKERMPIYRHYDITPDWTTMAGYYARLRKQGIGENIAMYVGATSVREAVIGYGDRDPTPAELVRMQGLVERAMREGAVGLSTALQYPPAPYAKTPELIALAKAASKYGGIYATHMRAEGDAEMAALDETFRIGREAHIPIEIFHLKAAGKPNWGKMPQVVARIDAARKSGLKVGADTYAYTAWMNSLSAFCPPWVLDGGADSMVARLKRPALRARIKKEMATRSTAWDNEWQESPGPHAILITAVTNPALVSLQGMRMDEIAKKWHEDPMDAIFDFLIKDPAVNIALFAMAEPDVELALRQPWVAIDNDASSASPDGLLGKEHPHPRAYGTFPRILRLFVREKHLLTLPEAIHKFTQLAAEKVQLKDRGTLHAGNWADVVVFDPATITDKATYENPNQLSVGMKYVLVNGVPVIADGKMTGALPGKVLLGPGYQPGAGESASGR